jgi:alpha-D-ribose 1-methylphosphonate 5-triphosphate synthase subunit PhnL
MAVMIELDGVAKSFTLHLRGGIHLPILDGVGLSVAAGECVVLAGPSGAGKSSVLKMIHGSYRVSGGRVRVRHRGGLVDVAAAPARLVSEIRRESVGYVSQFLRVIPRVSALEVVAEPALARGAEREPALARARELLAALAVPERLWGLPPATFSGGEQQRINVARGLAAQHPILLLDEPTASLDAANRAAVASLVEAAVAGGAAVLGVFHDAEVRDRIATRVVDTGGLGPGYGVRDADPDASVIRP